MTEFYEIPLNFARQEATKRQAPKAGGVRRSVDTLLDSSTDRRPPRKEIIRDFLWRLVQS
jgi:hypothetical protein